MSILGSVALSLCATFIGTEILGRAPVVAAWLLQKAIVRLPRKHRERYHEEWTADLQAQPTALSKLVFAFGLAIAARRILGLERRRIRTTRYKTNRFVTLWLLLTISEAESLVRYQQNEVRSRWGIVAAGLHIAVFSPVILSASILRDVLERIIAASRRP